MEHIAPILGLILGLALHLLKKHQEHRNSGQPTSLLDYLSARRYRVAISITGAATGYLVLWDTGQLTLVAAIGVGYVCDSVPDMLGTRARRNLENGS